MSHPLELDARKKIYEMICSYPGIHLRELQRKTEMATGALDYHLHYLHKNGFIRVEKDGGFVRYYDSMRAFSDREKQIISLLRNEKFRKILIFLLEKKISKAKKISKETGIKSSSLSSYLKILESRGIVKHIKKGRFRFYSISDRDGVINCLVVHRKSFLDKLVDNFISTWAEE